MRCYVGLIVRWSSLFTDSSDEKSGRNVYDDQLSTSMIIFLITFLVYSYDLSRYHWLVSLSLTASMRSCVCVWTCVRLCIYVTVSMRACVCLHACFCKQTGLCGLSRDTTQVKFRRVMTSSPLETLLSFLSSPLPHINECRRQQKRPPSLWRHWLREYLRLAWMQPLLPTPPTPQLKEEKMKETCAACCRHAVKVTWDHVSCSVTWGYTRTQQARSWQEKAGLARRQQLDLNHSKVVIACNTWPWYGNEKRRRWGWNKKWTTVLSKLEDEVYRKWLVVSRMKPERNYRQLISGSIKAAMGTVNGSSCLRHCMIRLCPHLLTFLSLPGKIRDYLACR